MFLNLKTNNFLLFSRKKLNLNNFFFLVTTQQRVQISKGPDGKLQVKGLMPG